MVGSGGIDPKKMSIEKFLPLDGRKQSGASSEGIQAFKKAREEYLKQLDGSRI